MNVKVSAYILNILIIYTIMAIIRSLGMIYLSLSIDFTNAESFLPNAQDIQTFAIFYYYLPYFVGLLIVTLFFKKFNAKVLEFILFVIIGILLFRFLDSTIIRRLFIYSNNALINSITSLVAFLLLGSLLFRIKFKVENTKNN